MSTQRVTAARDRIAEILEPHGFEIELKSGGKHDHVVCRGPIEAIHIVSRGTRNDRTIEADWARQWANRIVRRLEQGREA